MKWIVNRKWCRPGAFVGSVLVMAAEMTLLSISLMLFWIAAGSRNKNWYQEAVKLQVSTDAFGGQRTNSIFAALSVAVGLVTVFIVISVCIFRRLQLEQMERQLGTFAACGYERTGLERILAADVVIDLLISAPFAVYATGYLLNALKKKNEFMVILNSIQMDGLSQMVLFLGCITALYFVLSCYDKVWLKREMKGGTAEMLRKEN